MEHHVINVWSDIDHDEYVQNVMMNAILVLRTTDVEYQSF